MTVPRTTCWTLNWADGRVGDVRIPDSAVAQAAEQLCRETSEWLLYTHAVRTYLFSTLLARHDGLRVDEEALYVACVLHDLGLTSTYDDPVLPFEEAGARAAGELVETFGWAEPRRLGIERAIVLHILDEVLDSESAETRALSAGVACDCGGHRVTDIEQRAVDEVLRQYPRGPFKRGFPMLMKREAQRKPDCAAAAAVERGLITRLENSPFADSPLSPGR